MGKSSRPAAPPANQAIRESERLGNLPPYVFAELDRLKSERLPHAVKRRAQQDAATMCWIRKSGEAIGTLQGLFHRHS